MRVNYGITGDGDGDGEAEMKHTKGGADWDDRRSGLL